MIDLQIDRILWDWLMDWQDFMTLTYRLTGFYDKWHDFMIWTYRWHDFMRLTYGLTWFYDIGLLICRILCDWLTDDMILWLTYRWHDFMRLTCGLTGFYEIDLQMTGFYNWLADWHDFMRLTYESTWFYESIRKLTEFQGIGYSGVRVLQELLAP